MKATNSYNQETLDILLAAYGVLLNRDCWTQGGYARNEFDEKQYVNSSTASKFCGLGLLYAVSGDYSRPSDRAHRVIQDQAFPEHFADVNDEGKNPEEAYKKVVKIYEKAIMSLT